MTRRLKDGILTGFCNYCFDTEIPDIFALWTGIATISAALGRDCFVDMGHFTVFPNMYVVLVAGSAKCRKSTAINIAADFIRRIEPPIKTMSQKMTPEALIGSLSGTNVKGDSSIISEAVGVAVVDELATLIDANAFKSGMIPLLTKLYDDKDFPYETRSRGIELVKNPCLSILGGSTLHWIRESVPVVAIGGGFTSRVIFVFCDSSDKLVPWPKLTEENIKRGDAIAHDLCQVAKMRGAFGFTDNAKSMYSSEYKNFRERSPLYGEKSLAGYAGRRHDILTKLCMIVSASLRENRIVDEKDVGVALNILRNAEANMPRVLTAITAERTGDVCEEVLNIIRNKQIISRAALLTKMRYKLSAQELDIIINTLTEMRVVQAIITKGSVDYKYILGK